MPAPALHRALRIGVPAGLLELDPATGHGKVWRSVLAGLAEHARLLPDGAPRGRGSRWRPARPDVWLASGHEAPPDDAKAADGPPLVVLVHEAGWHDPQIAPLLSPEFRAAIERGTAQALAHASHVITPSQWSRRAVVAAYRVAPDRVHAVAHGVDAEVFRPGLRGTSDLVAERAGDEPAYVLFVGVAHPRKNLAALREAMKILAARGVGRALVIVSGEAGDREARAPSPGPSPTGSVRESCLQGISERQLAALMAQAGALCLPSLGEGFGLPALEALACGCPTVVSDRGALPEVVGEAGIVVAPQAPALASALESVLADPGEAARRGRAGRQRALLFPWSRTVAAWLAVLGRAARERGAR